MRHSLKHLRLLAIFTFTLLALASQVLAWPAGGVVAAPVPNCTQLWPHVLLGSQGEVLAFWADGRWHEGGGLYDLYGQLLSRNGLIAPGWSDTGLMIARAPDTQRPVSGLSLLDGSFIVGFADSRNFSFGGTGVDTYISRILPDGGIDPAWPRQGFRAIDRPDDDAPLRMTWVARDTLVILSPYLCCPDNIFRMLFQRVAVTPDGPQVLWGSAGLLYQWRPNSISTTDEILPDGAGGVFVLFDELIPSLADIDLYVMRLGRDGLPAPGWEGGARPLSAVPGIAEQGVVCGDGVGGMYIAWADARDGAGLPSPDYLDYENVRLQRLTPEATPYPGWPAEGLVVSDAPGAQLHPNLVPDGVGGVYVSYDDVTIAVTHVGPDGAFAPGWAKNGIQITTLPAFTTNSRMVLDGTGGVFAEFEDLSNNDLYLQRVLPGGAVDPAWPSTGYKVSGSTEGDIVPDGAGGCYVAGLGQLVPFGPSVVVVNRFGIGGVVPVKLADATADAEPGRVHLVWHGAEVTASESHVERRSESGDEWQQLGTPAPAGRDELEFDDLTAEAGASYIYRLMRGTEVLSNEVRVTVPQQAVFALAGATPNPALARELTVSLSLAGSAPARLEVLDLAGRREYERALTGLALGRHSLPLADARLAPGVHWLKLSQGAREAHARVVVVR